MAVAMLMNDNIPWWIVLPLNLLIGLFFGTTTWFVFKYAKGR